MIDVLSLISGSDIPFPALEYFIHQPTIKEISLIGEENFHLGLELLRFSKTSLSAEDQEKMANFTDFDIILSILNDKKEKAFKQAKINTKLVLTLLFPNCQIKIKKDCIVLKETVEATTSEGLPQEKKEHLLTNQNFSDFKQILYQVFCLKTTGAEEYNPQGEMAARIAQKFRERKKRLAELKPQSQKKISIFERYISILAVGLGKDINRLLLYTPYQLYDEFERYRMKVQYDMFIQAKMAGAKDIGEIEDWMKDIHAND